VQFSEPYNIVVVVYIDTNLFDSYSSMSTVVPIFHIDETKKPSDDNVSGSHSGSCNGSPNSDEDAAFAYSADKQCKKVDHESQKVLSCRKQHFTDDFSFATYFIIVHCCSVSYMGRFVFPIDKKFSIDSKLLQT